MNDNPSLDLMLRSLRLPSVLREHQALANTAGAAEWSYEQYLRALVELEINERHERKITRLLKRSNLPEGKNLATLDQKKVSVKVRRQIPALIEGGFVDRAENVLAFGLPGRGKTHLLSAIAHELIIGQGYAVLFTSTRRLVERLLIAKRDLQLEEMLKTLDRFDVVFLDPPFQHNSLSACAKRLEESGCLSDDAIIYLECERELTLDFLPKNWVEHRSKMTGQVAYYLYQRK